MSFKRWIQILMCLLITAVACGASAKEMTDKQRAQARELYDKATDSYDHGNYQDALDDWLAAYDLSENPVLLYSIANAYERLGKLEETIDALEGYKAVVRNSAEKEVLDMRLINLQERFKAQQEAERLREEARERERADAKAREAQLKEEQERLAEELFESQLAQVRRDPAGLRVTRGLFVALAGAGLVVGASYQIADRAVQNNLERDCNKLNDGGYLCIADRRDDLDKHQINQKIAMYSYIGAGVLGVTGLALYFVHPNKDKTIADLALEPVFYGDGGGARFSLKF